MITGNSTVFEEVGRWIERLDQPLPNAGLKNYVYKVKSAKATNLQTVLASLYSAVSQRIAQTPAAPPSPQQVAQATPFSVPPQPVGAPAAAPVQGDVRIISDELTNSLIIQTTPQQWSEIERTLGQLDVLPRQVVIDAQIYEVVLDDSLSLGISAFLQNRGTLVNPQTTASFAGNPPVLSAQTFAFIGRTRELVGF